MELEQSDVSVHVMNDAAAGMQEPADVSVDLSDAASSFDDLAVISAPPATLLTNTDVVELILAHHLQPPALRAMECVCKETRRLGKTEEMWRGVAARHVQLLIIPALHSLAEDGADSDRKRRMRLFWKKLCCFALVPNPSLESVAGRATATSTDRDAEAASNVLEESRCQIGSDRSLGCTCRRPCYWSSMAVRDGAKGTETLRFSELDQSRGGWCLVHAVAFRPFRACFHPGHPVYAPAEVSVTIRRERIVEPLLVTPAARVRADDAHVQTVAVFDPPLLLARDCTVDVEMRGAPQRCPLDDEHYICVSYAGPLGRSFSPLIF